MSECGKVMLVAAAGFVASMVVRLPLTRVPQAVNDSADYLSLGYHMAAGEGFISDVKWHFFNEAPARHGALGERPPAYPALLAVALKVSPTDIAAQVMTTIIGCLSVSAVVLLSGYLYGVAAAIAAAFLGCGATVMIRSGTVLEPVGMYGMWLVLMVLSALAAREDWRWGACTGLLVVLLYLTRPEGIVVGAAVVLWLALRAERRGVAAAGIFLIVTGAAYWLVKMRTGEMNSPSVYGHHMQVRLFAEGMWYGYGKKFPSVIEFLRENWAYAVRTFVRNAACYCLSVLRLSWLGIFIGVLMLAIVVHRTLPQHWRLLVGVGAVHCVAAAGMWSTTSGRPEPEHLGPPLVVLSIPLAAWGIAKLAGGRPARTALVAGVLTLTYLCPNIRAWSSRPSLLEAAEAYRPVCEAAMAYVEPAEVIASCRPWAVWWVMRRPTVILPRGLSREQQRKFLREYQVRAIVDWPSEAGPWADLPGVRKIFEDRTTGAMALVVARRWHWGLGVPVRRRNLAGGAEWKQ
jgi:hypothetical protein